MTRNYRNFSKTSRNPKRPYEKERLNFELRLVGEYGLKNKRELWRVKMLLAKIRKAARELLIKPEDDPERIFHANALMNRLVRYGLLNESECKLDFVLGLTLHKLLERRLQTRVFRQSHARSIHHARVLIRQGHIRVGSQTVNVPSFLVRLSSDQHIDFSRSSPYGGGKPGRVARKKATVRSNSENDD
ncbi:uncharacterized protein LOC142598121 [Dermatophagoides farinae]|uniref:uncharacterized protein LOC142598121 n=1 Tax=Dermatophagoides farinae TaxID=6954 RepID=UPI003F610B46